MTKGFSTNHVLRTYPERVTIIDPPARVTIKDEAYIVADEVKIELESVRAERDELKWQVGVLKKWLRDHGGLL